MKSSSSWKGFEFKPQGCLLQQVIEETPRVGIAYERSCNFYKDFHIHDRPILIFPRSSCTMDVRTKKPVSNYRINHSNFLTIPEHIYHDDEAVSSIYDTFALLPERKFIFALAAGMGQKQSQVELYLNKCNLLKRSKYLNYLLNEYFFNRIIEKQYEEKAEFLEKNIILEVLNLMLKINLKQNPEPTGGETDTPLVRALKYIETNLFDKLDVKKITRTSGMSQATLFREFKKQLKSTPYAYIQNRRLEEAAVLLELGQSVSEAAILVGYTNFGAFTDAFKKKFGKLPSKLKRS